MAAILKMAADKIDKISMFSEPLEMEIHLPVKFSKDRIISL
jgi:hypothetical protein